MKFYVYIADAKLDRLLASLAPEDKEQLANALGLPLRLLELPEVRRTESDETRFARADAVALHLEQTGAVGSPDSDRPYIADRGAVHWGRLRYMRGSELVRHETESPASFAFLTEARDVLMTGSASRLLAQPPSGRVDEATRAAADSRPWFALAARAAELDDVDERCFAQTFEEALPPTAADPADPSALAERALAETEAEAWMLQLARLRRDVRALPEGRLEFVAKRLATFAGGAVERTGSHFEPKPPVIVASPLFVAMTV